MSPVQTWLVILLLMFEGPAVGHSATLPDYQAAPKKEFAWLCDTGTTRIHTDLYRAGMYYVAVSGTDIGATFMSVYDLAEGRAQFLVNSAGTSEFLELPRDTWHERIRVEMSPNYFKRLRQMENDCRCILGCD